MIATLQKIVKVRFEFEKKNRLPFKTMMTNIELNCLEWIYFFGKVKLLSKQYDNVLALIITIIKLIKKFCHKRGGIFELGFEV